MSMTEQAAQMAQPAITQLTRQGARLTIKVGSLTASALLQALRESRMSTATTGQVTLKQLGKLSEGDVHAQKIDPDLKKLFTKQLRSYGVTFGVEKAPDNKIYIHFQGKDLPTLDHALEQTKATLAARTERKPATKQQVLARVKKRAKTISAQAKDTPKLTRAAKTTGAR